MAFTYILECRDGSYYVGSTRDLQARVAQHATGSGAAYTRRRLPVRLVWALQLDRIEDAFALEKRIQGWGRAKRQALIEGRFDDLPGLSRKKFTPRPVEDPQRRLDTAAARPTRRSGGGPHHATPTPHDATPTPHHAIVE